MNKSPLKWAGGKGKLLSQIIPLLPKEYNTYVEPFAGGLSLFFRLQPKKAFLCDINEELINFYIVLRDNLDDLVASLAKHEATEEYYFKIRDVDRTEVYKKWSNVERASRFLYLNKTCFNGLHRVNSKGHFNVPYGRRKNPKIIDLPTLSSCSSMLKTAKLIHGEYHSMLYDLKEGDFVYLDPPYAPISETSSFTSYTKEGFSESDQVQLCKFTMELTHRKIKWAMSNSDAETIGILYRPYLNSGLPDKDGPVKNIFEIQAARFINSKGDGRGRVREVLITNYEVEKPTKFIWEM